ncbi:MAG TPA: thiamine pyrophosphate-dependent enzyme, partial [Chloroflexota bacterium]
RPGPVHLTVPQDVLEAEVPEQWMDPRAFSMLGVVRPNCPAPTDLVAQGARLIEEAERPVLVAGSGVFYSGGAAALARLAASARIPVIVPIWDRGSVESRMPEFAGVVGAYSGGPDLLKDADLAILVGARVDYRLGYLDVPEVSAGLRVLRIDSDPVELHQGFEPKVAIQGDPKSVLEQITGQLSSGSGERHAGWLEEAKRRDGAFRRRWQSDAYTSSTPTGWHVVQALRPLVDNGAVLVVDGGNIGQWMHMTLCDRYPSDWLTCGASGVVGYGLGGAMASRLAYPERPVILLTGDGSIGFNLADIETAVRHDLPFVIVLADDRSWGVTASSQARQYGPENVVGCVLGPVRYDLAAEALGARGMRVEDPREIGAAVEEALASGRVTLIQVPIAGGGPAD